MTPGRLLVVDTHAFVWFLESDSRLGSAAAQAFSAPGARVVVPTIVLAEINFLHAKGRIQVSLADVLSAVAETDDTQFHPLDEAVAACLPTSLNIHDGIIVATALHLARAGHAVALLTRDAEIAASGLVDVVWR